jgi:hypothetical protein
MEVAWNNAVGTSCVACQGDTILQESDAHSLLGSRRHTAHRIPASRTNRKCRLLLQHPQETS